MPLTIDREKFRKLSPEKQQRIARLSLQYKYYDKLLNPPIPTFKQFFEETSPYKLEQWQEPLANRYTELTGQTGQRIKIHKPPQHGGSIMTAQRLCPYYLGVNPNARVRLLTYNITHSERFGVVIKNIMLSEEYKRMFPKDGCRIHHRTKVGEWFTKERKSKNDSQASFMALGLESGFMGTGGDLVIIDDPYQNREQAFSETINQKLWYFYKELLIPRLNPESNVIVMFHAFNEFDFAAKLKDEGGWEELRFAAICDSANDPCGRNIGEALSPRYPIERLLQLRDGYTNDKGEFVEGMGEAAFESLYQGNPKPREGNQFKLHFFNYVVDYARHENGFFVRYWDTASSGKQSADRTSGTLIYKNPIGRYTIIDNRADKLSPSQRDDFIKNTCQEDKDRYGHIAPVFNFVEQPPGAGVEVIDALIRECAEYGLRANPVRLDKIARAMPIIAQMERGNVDVMKGAWNFSWQEELLGFPGAKNDDRVDSTTGAFNMASAINYL